MCFSGSPEPTIDSAQRPAPPESATAATSSEASTTVLNADRRDGVAGRSAPRARCRWRSFCRALRRAISEAMASARGARASPKRYSCIDFRSSAARAPSSFRRSSGTLRMVICTVRFRTHAFLSARSRNRKVTPCERVWLTCRVSTSCLAANESCSGSAAAASLRAEGEARPPSARLRQDRLQRSSRQTACVHWNRDATARAGCQR